MTGIEKIVAHIEAEAASESQAVLAEASAKCKEIQNHYEKAAGEEYDKAVGRGASEAASRIDRLGHVDALEAKKQVLAVKQEMVSFAFDLAARKLSELPEDDHVAFLVRLAVAASRSGSEQIVLSPVERARIGNTVCTKANEALASAGKTAKLTLSQETRAIRGGLILVSGDIEVNCSFDTLLLQHKNELSSKVAAVLFD